jgi:uncharacterized protein YPO0396
MSQSVNSSSSSLENSGAITQEPVMTPEALEILINCNQADLNSVSRQVAELHKKWDQLQEERARLLKLQRGCDGRQAD